MVALRGAAAPYVADVLEEGDGLRSLALMHRPDGNAGVSQNPERWGSIRLTPAPPCASSSVFANQSCASTNSETFWGAALSRNSSLKPAELFGGHLAAACRDVGGGAAPDTEVLGDVFLAQAAPC